MTFCRKKSNFLANGVCAFSIFAVAAFGFSVSCYAQSTADILNRQINDISSKNKASENKIRNIKRRKQERSSLAADLNKRKKAVEEEFLSITKRIDDVQNTIYKTEESIKVSEKELEKCYQDLTEVLGKIDKSVDVSSGLDVLFETSSLAKTDDDDRVVYTSLSEWGNHIVLRTKETKKMLWKKKKQLETDKSNLKDLQIQLDEKGRNLDEEKRKNSELLSKLADEEKSESSILEARKIEEEKLRAKLYALQKASSASKSGVNLNFNGFYLWPVNGCARISSPFGKRGRRMHNGIDIPVGKCTPVMAAADGVVVTVGCEPQGWGNYIMVDHGNGHATLYAHLSEFKVAPGQVVKRGHVIALSGNTGRSTGPHLHFETWVNGKRRNPMEKFR